MSDWRDDALCREVDASLFFPVRAGDQMTEAKQVCRGCPVQQPCLAEALGLRDTYGYRGGTTGDQRKQILAGKPAQDIGVDYMVRRAMSTTPTEAA